MLEGFLDDITDVIILKSVKYVFTRLTIADKIALSQNLKLMRNGRFGHSEQACNIADAHRLSVDCEKYADSC